SAAARPGSSGGASCTSTPPRWKRTPPWTPSNRASSWRPTCSGYSRPTSPLGPRAGRGERQRPGLRALRPALVAPQDDVTDIERGLLHQVDPERGVAPVRGAHLVGVAALELAPPGAAGGEVAEQRGGGGEGGARGAGGCQRDRLRVAPRRRVDPGCRVPHGGL